MADDEPHALPETDAIAWLPPAGPRRGVLWVTSGGPVGRLIRVDSAVTIGRAPTCTLAIDEGGISRVHAEVVYAAGSYFVKDARSRNGTFVNDVRVDFSAPLSDGDTIRVGAALMLRFALVSVDEEVALTRSYEAATGQLRALDAPRDAAPGTASDRVVVDPAMRALYDEARRAARSPISVLILGETGVGKEVLARAVHLASPRAKGPFVAVNCAALAESLLESELFGHEKGAFTGAVQARPGLFEAADGGTLFLDELGELPLGTQVKLLRVLEEREITRVGARTPRRVDVRFVAATNQDVEEAVKAGRFRADLFFRLNGISLAIPPLRERTSDIAELATKFAKAAAQGIGQEHVSVDPDALALLQRYAWPGNVRELRNVIDRAVVLGDGVRVTANDLPARLREAAQPASAPASKPALRDEIDALEKSRVLEVLAACGGNQTRAAEALSVSRRTLVSRLTEWGMTRSRAR